MLMASADGSFDYAQDDETGAAVEASGVLPLVRVDPSTTLRMTTGADASFLRPQGGFMFF